MRDFVIGTCAAALVLVAAPGRAQTPAATCAINIPDGSTLSGVRQLTATVDAPGGVMSAALTVGGFPFPATLTGTGSTAPEVPNTQLVLTGWLDTTARPDGPLAVHLDALNGTATVCTADRALTIHNAPPAPPTPPTPPRLLATSYGFRGNGSAKLVDVAATETATVSGLSLYGDVAGTARLVTGTGTWCGTDRENLTRAYPVTPGMTLTFLPTTAPTGKAVCLYFVPTAPAAQMTVAGDLRATVQP